MNGFIDARNVDIVTKLKVVIESRFYLRNMNEKIETLLKFIEESNNIVFFGGAGVSTESGIPDFRSKDGLYNQHDVQFEKYDPEYLLSLVCWFNNPKVFYEFYRQKMDTRNIEPNITHKVLAELERIGKLKAIVTQNIDGLHQKAGSKNGYEIHGTTQKNKCFGCGMEYCPDFIFETKEKIPTCNECGEMIKPEVVLYGESLPDEAVNNAIGAIFNADLLIIGGTSLTVQPAASFITYFRGNHMVIIDQNVTWQMKNILNPDNDLAIEGSLGSIFYEIDKWIKQKRE